MTAPFVSIVVPTFRRPEALRATLAALLALDYNRSRYELIVVDDAADDRTRDVVRSLQVRDVDVTVESQDRRGAATARNRGARAAAGELLLFCDDDILVERDHLVRHCLTRERYADPLVNGTWEFEPSVLAALRRTPFGRYRIELEQEFQAEASGEPLTGGIMRMAMLGSWDLVLGRELFWQLGGFNEGFPVAGAEDQDFSLRARAAGCPLLLDTAIRCLHNDNRLTLRAYCERERRSAQTMPYLVVNYPAQFAESSYVSENRPIRRADPPQLVLKKLAKSALARGPVFEALYRFTGLLESLKAPDRLLRRLYRVLLGLSLFSGFRTDWK